MKQIFKSRLIYLLLAVFAGQQASGQTDVDGIMMSKNNFCTGFQYTYSEWKNYWEGTMKRDNENLGTVSTQMIGWMGNYGITSKVNALFSIPYVKTKTTAGTLHGVEGLQDLMLGVKYNFLDKRMSSSKLKLIGVASYSFPVTNYVADYQPLSLGLKSKNLALRLTGDFEVNHFFVTASAAYINRSNVKIDRTSYYTTEMHNTNEVEMPDAGSFILRTGWRGNFIGAEAVFTNMTTFGGFDITRNNMPFPSNRMNATTAGINLKCNPKAAPGLSLMAGGNYCVGGRNVGQTFSVNGGVFYVFDFNSKKAK